MAVRFVPGRLLHIGMTPNDSELLRRYLHDRSEAAFAELVRRHIDLVYSSALRQVSGDVHAAQDVAQNYGMCPRKAVNAIARLVARYGE